MRERERERERVERVRRVEEKRKRGVEEEG